jgi:hypothetical protein
VIGGFVYHGSAIPSLQGIYLFADFGTGKIWELQETSPNNWTRTLVMTTDFNISSFGQDQAGEIYVVDLAGRVLRLQAN